MVGPAQRRRQILTNRSMAGLLGMHREEILARFANHDVQLPFSETDYLRFFIHDLGDEPIQASRFHKPDAVKLGAFHLPADSSPVPWRPAAVSCKLDTQRFYYRSMHPDGGPCLVCCISLRVFNSSGSLVTVRGALACTCCLFL